MIKYMFRSFEYSKKKFNLTCFSRVKTPEGLLLLSKIKLFDRAKDNETDLEIKRMLKENHPLKLSFDNFEREHGLVVIYQNMRGFRTNIRTYFSWCMVQ